VKGAAGKTCPKAHGKRGLFMVVHVRQRFVQMVSHIAALVRSRMNCLKPFERTTEQTTGTMPSTPTPNPKTITAAAMTTKKLNYKLTRHARLPQMVSKNV